MTDAPRDVETDPAFATRVEHDSSTGRPVLVAPNRAVRPLHTVTGRDHAAVCPFCQGAEGQTPPERDAVRPAATDPDTPGWRVRAFPNLYPAARWHEVVAEGPEHESRPSRLDAALWVDVLTVWRRRLAFLEAQDEVACGFLFKNVGREAGASVAHNHSQVLGLPMVPPRLVEERARAEDSGSLPGPELADAAGDGRLVFETDHFAVFAPRHPRLPDATWLAPKDPFDVFDEGRHAAELAELLARWTGAVDAALGPRPFNFWLSRIPDERFHWHFEIQPRTGFLAGLELGADVYINARSPVETAARMRDA